MNKIILTSLAVSALALGTFTAVAAVEPGMMGSTSKGQAWVNTKGMTLYSFDKDTALKSNCVDACAAAWPPVKAEKDHVIQFFAGLDAAGRDQGFQIEQLDLAITCADSQILPARINGGACGFP